MSQRVCVVCDRPIPRNEITGNRQLTHLACRKSYIRTQDTKRKKERYPQEKWPDLKAKLDGLGYDTRTVPWPSQDLQILLRYSLAHTKRLKYLREKRTLRDALKEIPNLEKEIVSDSILIIPSSYNGIKRRLLSLAKLYDLAELPHKIYQLLGLMKNLEPDSKWSYHEDPFDHLMLLCSLSATHGWNTWMRTKSIPNYRKSGNKRSSHPLPRHPLPIQPYYEAHNCAYWEEDYWERHARPHYKDIIHHRDEPNLYTEFLSKFYTP